MGWVEQLRSTLKQKEKMRQNNEAIVLVEVLGAQMCQRCPWMQNLKSLGRT